MKVIRKIMAHLCVICCLVCLTAKILDWYNPFMDFSGHMAYIQIILYLTVPVMVFTRARGK